MHSLPHLRYMYALRHNESTSHTPPNKNGCLCVCLSMIAFHTGGLKLSQSLKPHAEGLTHNVRTHSPCESQRGLYKGKQILKKI